MNQTPTKVQANKLTVIVLAAVLLLLLLLQRRTVCVTACATSDVSWNQDSASIPSPDSFCLGRLAREVGQPRFFFLGFGRLDFGLWTLELPPICWL